MTTPPVIKRLFIANRGEIARRIALGAKNLGIATVAISRSPHPPQFLLGLIDEFIIIPDESTATYLNADLMVDLAKRHGCNAVHPGFGFLSENAGFAAKVQKAGLIWVGPSPRAIDAMASKEKAKELAVKAGLPCVPALKNIDLSTPPGQTKMISDARAVGFPLLIKAALGGGGKGMRLCENEASLLDLAKQAAREALSSFGDDTLIIEKYLAAPRHIEVQVFGDLHGNVVTLGDRDCSVQRRHQKVIEEAPALGLTDATRRAMHEAARKLAKAVDYASAGTVEFLVDWSQPQSATQPFYFLEMNTRLQVEHPVTEEVFSLDLVGWQLKIAQGEKIPASWHDRKPDGHSVEVRLYAEDVQRGFLPAPGVVQAFRPFQAPGVRWEVGIDEVDEITSLFDPMVAKVVVTAETRAAALKKLNLTLQQTVFCGPVNNFELVQIICEDEEFVETPVTTHYLRDHMPRLLKRLEEARSAHQDTREDLLRRLTAQGFTQIAATSGSGVSTTTARIFSGKAPTTATHDIMISQEFALRQPRLPNWQVRGGSALRQAGDAAATSFAWVEAHGPRGKMAWVKVGGYASQQERHEGDRSQGKRSALHGDLIIAPVPGKVKQILVKAGDEVKKNQTVFVLESMKMDFEVQSPKAGMVAAIKVSEGAQVNADELLMTWRE